MNRETLRTGKYTGPAGSTGTAKNIEADEYR